MTNKICPLCKKQLVIKEGFLSCNDDEGYEHYKKEAEDVCFIDVNNLLIEIFQEDINIYIILHGQDNLFTIDRNNMIESDCINLGLAMILSSYIDIFES